MGEKIAFLDTEISTTSGKIENIGLLFDDFGEEKISISDLNKDFAEYQPDFICGHNFVNFDKKYLANTSFKHFVEKIPIIDTLYLSLLLSPDKATHKLDKPYKREIHRETPENSPLEDAKNTAALFYHLDEKFDELPLNLQAIFAFLLKDDEKFKGYFLYKQSPINKDIETFLQSEFQLSQSQIEPFLNFRVELAFVLSFMCIFNQDSKYFSPYILKNHSEVTKILKSLTQRQDVETFAKAEFNIDSFYSFNILTKGTLNLNNQSNQISQLDIIKSALNDESFLAILPTGGGKTYTFQIPALIKARQYKGLTVVISPLQALMKNHIDSFKVKNQNFSVEAISGFLDPMQRAENFEKLLDGTINILYLAPESLRSNAIFKALQCRYIERFVIDEAHCFSMWGHNFRQDYHFIAQSIRDLEQSLHQDKIPVSCFTATAKPEVIEDIKDYFKQNLDLNLKEFIAENERKELSYDVCEIKADEHEKRDREKKDKLWKILKAENNGKKNPTIIYTPQNARLCRELCDWLREQCKCEDEPSWEIEAFYAGLDDDISRLDEDKRKDRRNKAKILQDFIDDKIDIIIATTAFGMGIDKPNITTIIHYELSDSLESYMQESGRGARDKKYQAKCYILYDKNDIDKNFAHLRRSNLDFGEIRKLAAVLKNEYNTKKKNPLLISLKQLHKKMGKSEEKFDPTTIKTAILELEKAGILKRKRVSTQIYASAFKIRQDKMAQARNILDPQKEMIESKQKTQKLEPNEETFLRLYGIMTLIIQHIIQRSRENSIISLDELGDIVGEVREKDMDEALKILSKNGLISQENDIRALINIKEAQNKMGEFLSFEMNFFDKIETCIRDGERVDLREFNDDNLKKLRLDTKANPLYTLKFIINTWKRMLKFTQRQLKAHFKNNICVFEKFKEIDKLKRVIIARKKIFTIMLEIIKERYMDENERLEKQQEIFLPSKELYKLLNEKENFTEKSFAFLFKNMDEILEKDFEITGGRFIYYQKECLEFTETIKEHTPYGSKDYKVSLQAYQKQRIINTHILRIFLEKFISGKDPMKFMKDYFVLSQSKFFEEHHIDEKEVTNPISKDLLDKIIKDLNLEQEKILKDDRNKAIMILAGPGSGKTKTLVHKIAYLLTFENKKSENFLMLAHSKVAVREFRDRLYKILGAQSLDVTIMTFHAFALNLIGKKIYQESELDGAISFATKALNEGEISLPYIDTLMLDEYQDVTAKSYEFIKAIYSKMSGKKQIIAVGDDDQLINDFNGADIKFLQDFEKDFTPNVRHLKDRLIDVDEFARYVLMTNYRSNAQLVSFNNAYRKAFLKDGLKSENLVANPKNKQEGFISFTQHSLQFSLRHIANEVCEFVSEKARKSIAVLVRSNDEVLALAYEFEQLGIKAKAILETDGFQIGDLIELWEYLELLKNGDSQEQAKTKICEKYKDSANLGIFENALNLFEEECAKYDDKNANDFEDFLDSLNFEVLDNFKNAIIISTMHKAKGKEFDNVFVGLDEKFDFNKDSERRLLYVAFTRAKHRLFIHSKNDILAPLKEHFNEFKVYDKKDDITQKISYMMTLEDIFLGNEKAQKNIKYLNQIGIAIKAGQLCEIRLYKDNGNTYINIFYAQTKVGSLSKSFVQKLLNKTAQGYELEPRAKICYVVKWLNKKTNEDTIQILCEIILKKAQIL